MIAVTATANKDSQPLLQAIKAAYTKHIKANNGQCCAQSHGTHVRMGLYDISKPFSNGFVKRNQVAPGVLMVLDSSAKLRFVGRHDGGRLWTQEGIQNLMTDWPQRPALPWDFAGCV